MADRYPAQNLALDKHTFSCGHQQMIRGSVNNREGLILQANVLLHSLWVPSEM